MASAVHVGISLDKFWRMNSWELLQVTVAQIDLLKRKRDAVAGAGRSREMKTPEQVAEKLFSIVGRPEGD